jgi:hypothetical protein
MKTAREWFKELPDDIEKMAVENAEKCPDGIIIDDRIFEDLSDAIEGSFTWIETPQGHDFWQNVYDQHCE